MFERTKRNDDDMDLDDVRTGRGVDDSQTRSTSPRRDDEDEDRGGMNRGTTGGTKRTGQQDINPKKK